MDTTQRNYNTISQSAKSLLLMKALTNIPFARQVADLMASPSEFKPDTESQDLGFWLRTLHFETRYWSIDQLLSGLEVKNILELSSGFSFRGLDMTQQKDVHYIDTDLEDVVAHKSQFIDALRNDLPDAKGTFEILPLNALDEKRFEEIVSHFPDGRVAIVNEGLLMYLGDAEKKQLCGIIHKILKQRGGYWITADIYMKRKPEIDIVLKPDSQLELFLKQHNIEDNKFDSFEQAESFFNDNGFIKVKEALPDYSKTTSLQHVRDLTSEEQLLKMRSGAKAMATWMLKAV